MALQHQSQQIARHLAAVCCERFHDLTMQESIHRLRIVEIALIVQLHRQLLAMHESRIHGQHFEQIDD